MTSQFADMTSSPIFFFDLVLFLLSSLANGPIFLPNSIAESGVIIIFFYKGLTRNLEIGNTEFSPISVGQVRDTKFGKIASNKMLLNATKCQVYSFYRF